MAQVAHQLKTGFENLPPLNFAVAQDRLRMEKAVDKVRAQLGASYCLKTGEKLDKRNTQWAASLDPSSPEQVVGYVEYASSKEVEEALQQLEKGSRSWKKRSPFERAELIDRLAEWMIGRRCELAAWQVFEVGKNWRESDGDVCEAVDFCRFYANEMRRLAEPIRTQAVEGEADFLTYQGRGVAAIIAPWNFPLAILTGMTTASLVAGNVVAIKPAEQSSVMAAYLTQGLREVGFPEDSFYFLPGIGEEIGPLLVDDPRVDLITFTGSVDVGLEIIEKASRKPKAGQRGVKKVVAEMGGKNALIIDADADPDEAVLGSVKSAFGFQGQKCSALSRLLVHESCYDHFVKRFVEATRSLKIGPPTDPQFQVGPVIDAAAQRRILKTIDEASDRLKVLYRAEDLPPKGYYVPPSLFELEDSQDFIFQNEIFGPVVGIKKVKDVDEALAVANDSRFALTGGMYSRSPSNIEKVKEDLEVGNLYINRPITGSIVQRHPFGGYKFSGVGSKAGGPDYLLQFMEPKMISENTVRRGFAGEV